MRVVSWRRRTDLGLGYGDAESSLTICTVPRRVSTNQPANENVVADSIANRVPPIFDYIESQLPEQGFFFGDISVADIAVVSATINASYSCFEVDSELWPKVSSHLQLVKEHPLVRKCMEAEKPLIDALIQAQADRQN